MIFSRLRRSLARRVLVDKVYGTPAGSGILGIDHLSGQRGTMQDGKGAMQDDMKRS
jgi:hypothetical protein